MVIKTKFGIGDKVWIMENNKPVCVDVYSVLIKAIKGFPQFEEYEILNSPRKFKLSELFSTKQELLESF